MPRIGRYVRPGVRASAPGVLFSLVIDPTVSPGDASGRVTEYQFGSAAVCVSRWRNGRWTKPTSATADTPRELFRFMNAQADPGRRNYVVCPSVGEYLSLSRFWERTDPLDVIYAPQHVGQVGRSRRKPAARKLVIRRVVMSPRVGILDYCQHGVRWLWLSAGQYFAADEESVARSMGWSWPDTGAAGAGDGRPYRSKRDRASMWLDTFQQLSVWWRKNAKCAWGLTAASMSFGILRTHVPERTLCTHSDGRVHQLERHSAFGGRAAVWYFGDVGEPRGGAQVGAAAPPRSKYGSIPGPLVNLDVRSMYPSILRDYAFPVKLRSYRDRCRPGDAQGFAQSYGVVARVTIETAAAEYPERVGDRIYYRTGRFTTTLTGPELCELRRDGRVLATHEIAVYDLGRPFRDASAALIDMRRAAQCDRRPAWELFAKLLANGLAGKLAQRKGTWEHVPDKAPPYPWGEWIVADARGRQPARYRAVAGITFRYKPDPNGEGPHTAAFAYLAAYGRLLMRHVRESLPERSVVAQDTDGIWCLLKLVAGARCVKWQGGGAAGDLVPRERADAGRWYTPKHYWTSDGWTLAGFRMPEVEPDGLTVRDTFRLDNTGRPSYSAPVSVSVLRRTSKLRPESHGMRIGPDGWAVATQRR